MSILVRCSSLKGYSKRLAEVFSKDVISFLASCQNLVPRPWVIDDLDNFQAKWIKKPWKKAVIFVDNSGADIILGILSFARELLLRGTQVCTFDNDRVFLFLFHLEGASSC
ncbi:PREDICTED: uncharacterized protein At2g17340-like isoform X1 [Camelina sativa]|uniref:Uncharacterized protein At2g17340-like isoform X1 n=1 Tax=Camelina sativa TaxID=90675 RepID=A0ABM0WG14_CAMSA|nr:PREDICTED: uncharacterized protein At2g17340-like isoform X1 [Camelina sativa]XP_010470584.1 PREDICTED: uncharacterized protein At2g17340-like isoform X1 [Camelina sativa]